MHSTVRILLPGLCGMATYTILHAIGVDTWAIFACCIIEGVLIGELFPRKAS